MRRWRFLVTAAVLLLAASFVFEARGIEKISPDPKGVALVDELVKALSIADADARVKALLPLVHKSLLSRDGKDLDWNVKDYSYKKAWQNVKFYKQPVEIHEVHKGNVFTIGFRETAERGRGDKYFIKKKEGINGMPAPISIFWPENGGDPKVIDMGSL
ncbi:MAG: hypothetical protein HYU64_07100 [Armatimonadetes bacterium]|nr:hypothetical protein [Armatimonadota bacterium]